MQRAAAALLVGAVACVSASAPPTHVEPAVRGRYAMGTLLEITLHGSDAARLAAALDAVAARVAELDARMSRYASESDVSRLNRAAGGAPLAVDPAVRELLDEAVRLAALTRGAFDVSVGPLVELWMHAAESNALPSPAALAAARARVGVDGIRIAADGRVALRAGAAIDLGGLAKGYALDRALAPLAAHGVESALLNFGQSSLWALGRPPDAPGWRLLVRAPQGGFAGVVTLRDQALSVSGSLGQWSEIEGRRYGHVLDPRSGWPLTQRREALVVAPTATLAEALSTALLVLGERDGIALVEAQPGCEALLLDATGQHWETSRWAAATRFAPLPAQAG